MFLKRSWLKGVLVHYGKTDPVIIIYPTRGAAASLRLHLSLCDFGGYYYDPCAEGKPLKLVFIFKFSDYEFHFAFKFIKKY